MFKVQAIVAIIVNYSPRGLIYHRNTFIVQAADF